MMIINNIFRRFSSSSRPMKIALAVLPAWSVDVPPLGASCIAAALKDGGHECSVFDFNVQMHGKMLQNGPDLWDSSRCSQWEFEKDFEKEILPIVREGLDDAVNVLCSGDYDAVGFSVFGTSLYSARYAAGKLKKQSPRTKIFYGGPAAQAFKLNDVLHSGTVDAAVFQEGEHTVLELLDAWRKGRSPAGMPGVIARDGKGNIVCGPRRKPVPPGRLPIPDFSQYNLEDYLHDSLPIMMSRGCVGACNFCTERDYWKPYRVRPPEKILEEFKNGVEQFGVRNFFTADSLLNGDHKNLETLMDMIATSGLNLRWGGYARVDKRLSSGLLKKMAAAGCTYLAFGLESGSQKILNLMNKKISVEQASKNFRDAFNAGIMVNVNLIVGFPGEDENDVGQTLEFLEQHKDCINEVNTGETMGISREMTLWSNAGNFGVVTDENGAPKMDGPNGWMTADGSNTFQIRRIRLMRVRRSLGEMGIKYNPAPE